MDNAKFNKNEISIHSACDIDSTLLIDFYKKAYPKRINYLDKYSNLVEIESEIQAIIKIITKIVKTSSLNNS